MWYECYFRRNQKKKGNRKMKKPTIYEIKRNLKNAPYFFSRESMKTFGQTMKSFRIYKTKNPLVFEIIADIYDKYSGKKMNVQTHRFYNAESCTFVQESDV